MAEETINVAEVPDEIITLKNVRPLAYGENRCQSPAFIYSGGSNNPLAISKFIEFSGKASYISLADISQLVSILTLIAESFRRWKGKVPFIAVAGKHGNPCGLGIDWNDPDIALRKALFGDPVAVMGGEIVTNFGIDSSYADRLFYAYKDEIGRERWGLDVIAAPWFTPKADELLAQRQSRRLLVNQALEQAPFPEEEWTYRELHGGDWLKQRLSSFVLTPEEIVYFTGEKLSDDFFSNLIISQACGWRASSNTVVLAKDRSVIGVGCGQQDRRACGRLCLDRANRAGHDTKGSVFASDGFLPYATSQEISPNEAKQLMNAAKKLHGRLVGKNRREKIVILDELSKLVSRLDRRETTELLADAGCIGGVVPYDGNHKDEVAQFFAERKMSVAFVAPENRGFSKH